jgi:hypothetical protein
MIGASAMVATATFQLFMAFRSRKADFKPKRGSGMRSTLAVFGLVLARRWPVLPTPSCG